MKTQASNIPTFPHAAATVLLATVPAGDGLPLGNRDQLNQIRGGNMKSKMLMCMTAMTLFAALAITVPLAAQDNPQHQPTFTTFDAPGAGTGPNQGTFAYSINPGSAITGYYYDANFVARGFVRHSDGTITTFDAPGDVNGTVPVSINPEGAITGYYCDANFVCPGFLRAHDGTITTFDAPGDVNGTNPNSINPAGAITGYYYDANFVGHGFVRDRYGTITTFDVPGATNGTFANSINPAGTITGGYTDASNTNHNFVRDRDGTFTTFDVPGANTSRGQSATAINPGGVITGSYFQPIVGNPFGGNYRGFVRNLDGTFSTFDAATYPPCCIWTFPWGINPNGAVTGYDNDGHNLNHGFVRDPNGTITTFDVPGAGTGNYQGTIAWSINPTGAITGFYFDANSVAHGYVRKGDCDQKKDCGKGE